MMKTDFIPLHWKTWQLHLTQIPVYIFILVIKLCLNTIILIFFLVCSLLLCFLSELVVLRIVIRTLTAFAAIYPVPDISIDTTEIIHIFMRWCRIYQVPYRLHIGYRNYSHPWPRSTRWCKCRNWDCNIISPKISSDKWSIRAAIHSGIVKNRGARLISGYPRIQYLIHHWNNNNPQSMIVDCLLALPRPPPAPSPAHQFSYILGSFEVIACRILPMQFTVLVL